MNEDLRGSIDIANSLVDHGEITESERKALTLLITTAEQVLKAGEELPEKLKNQATATADGFKCVVFVDGTLIPVTVTEANFYNYALSLCLPILAKYKAKAEGYKQASILIAQEQDKELAKKNLRIAELEEALRYGIRKLGG